jgi:hypothetical protein
MLPFLKLISFIFVSKKLVLPSKRLKVYRHNILEPGTPILETNPSPSPYKKVIML